MTGKTPTTGTSVLISDRVLGDALRVVATEDVRTWYHDSHALLSDCDEVTWHDVLSLATVVEALLLYDSIVVGTDHYDFERDFVFRGVPEYSQLFRATRKVNVSHRHVDRALSTARRAVLGLVESGALQREHDRLDRPYKGWYRFPPFAEALAWIDWARTEPSMEGCLEYICGTRDQPHGDYWNARWMSVTSFLDRFVGSTAEGLFFDILALLEGVAHFPHPWHAEILRLVGPAEDKSGSFAEHAVTLVADARAYLALDATRLQRLRRFDVDLPLLLAWVLRNASRPEEILEICLHEREAKNLRAFRRWAQDIDAASAEGNLKTVSKALSLVDAAIRDLGVHLPQRHVEIQIGLLAFPQLAVQIGLEIPSPPKRRRHLRWLQDLRDVALSITTIDTDLRRIFGKRYSERPERPFYFYVQK